MKDSQPIPPDWKWGTAEGSREFDRLMDRRLTFREKVQWIEEAETLAMRLRGHHANQPRLRTGPVNPERDRQA
jgi:hypothetical protein